MSISLHLCVFILCTWMILPGFGENTCPEVAELNTKYTISTKVNKTIIVKSFTWRKPPNNTQAIACDLDSGACISTDPSYSGAIDNGTLHLVINNVMKGDSGLWRLRGRHSSAVVDVCYLVTARKPQCNIKSVTDADDLDLGVNMNLTVDIMGYFCSKNSSFALTTGDVTQMLSQSHSAENITDNVNFNVSLARFGDVTLKYSCANTNWTLQCNGIRKLIKSRPQCNVSSDRQTDDLDLGDELTLTVNIKGYYCPRAANFTLTTGTVTDELLGNHVVLDVTDATKNVNFTLTQTRLGFVIVTYGCDGDAWMLNCGGVKQLNYRASSTTWSPSPSLPSSPSSASLSSLPTTSQKTSTPTNTESTTPANAGLPIAVIIGVSVALLLLILIVVVIVVTRRKLERIARKYVVQNKKTPDPPEDDE